MADALISYAVAIGVFVGLVVILFSTRTKRRIANKKETHAGTSEEIKYSSG